MNAFVYFNVRTRQFSVRNVATGRVARRGRYVVLRDVRFHVNEKGRQRVIHTFVKNVHAGARGRTSRLRPGEQNGLVAVRYSPHEGRSFYRIDDGRPVSEASLLVMTTATITQVGQPDRIVPVLLARL